MERDTQNLGVRRLVAAFRGPANKPAPPQVDGDKSPPESAARSAHSMGTFLNS
jgi:hypothetical protein